VAAALAVAAVLVQGLQGARPPASLAVGEAKQHPVCLCVYTCMYESVCV
jgi:hypothetical protein